MGKGVVSSHCTALVGFITSYEARPSTMVFYGLEWLLLCCCVVGGVLWRVALCCAMVLCDVLGVAWHGIVCFAILQPLI